MNLKSVYDIMNLKSIYDIMNPKSIYDIMNLYDIKLVQLAINIIQNSAHRCKTFYSLLPHDYP